MDYTRLFGLLCILGALVTIASLFTFYPRETLRLQARFMRFLYKDCFQMSNEAIDRMPLMPGTRHLIGTLSRFVSQGEQHPEEFPKLQGYNKTLGCIMWGMLILTATVVGWAIVTGKPMYWP